MTRTETFGQATVPNGFYWFHEPAHHACGQGLDVWTDPETDFWQRTHYGFRRDDGHCLLTDITGDFCVTTHVTFEPQQQYDQCGLIVRIDPENWLKVSTEYESPSISRLGSVVTNLGYSDWATQDVSSEQSDVWYRISRRGPDFKVEASYNGSDWKQLRIAHLHQAVETLAVGVYACSPIGQNFHCRFLSVTCEPNQWFSHAG